MFKKIRNYVKQHDQYGHKFSLNVGTTNNETNSFIGGAISLSMRTIFSFEFRLIHRPFAWIYVFLQLSKFTFDFRVASAGFSILFVTMKSLICRIFLSQLLNLLKSGWFRIVKFFRISPLYVFLLVAHLPLFRDGPSRWEVRVFFSLFFSVWIFENVVP